MLRAALLSVCVALAGLPAHAEEPRVFMSLGQLQSTRSATEVQLRYIGAPIFWKLQPVVGGSMAGDGSGHIGIGNALTWRSADSRLFARVSSIAGVHKRGNGKALGGPIMFRTALDLGVMSASGIEYGIGLDHRSSARIYRPNPGLNTAYLFASVKLR